MQLNSSFSIFFIFAYARQRAGRCGGWERAPGDGMQTAALADCERLRTNRRHAHLRQTKKRLQLIYCN